MNGNFTTIVVPLDLKPNSERAAAVAGAVAAMADLPVVLLTVTTEDRQEPDKARLHQIAAKFGLDNWDAVVLHGHHPAREIGAYVATHDHPLIVMASPVHGAVSEWLSASTVAHVLSEVSCPVLVLGPHVDREWKPEAARLIACAEPDWDADAALEQIVRWDRTFAAPTPWIVEVVEPEDGIPPDPREGALVMRVADRLAHAGIRVDWEVLHDDKPVDGLLRFAESVGDGVFVVTSERWADPAHVHAQSVSRQLAHRSPLPVLVVPHAFVTAA